MSDDVQAALGAGLVRISYLLWARVRSATGAPVVAGWTDDHFDRVIEVDGEDRTFVATAGAFAVAPERVVIGTRVATYEITFAATEDFDFVLRQFNLSRGGVDVFRAFWGESGDLIGVTPVFRGLIDETPIVDGPTQSTRVLRLVSASARGGTHIAGQLKSNSAQLLRSPTDRFFEYGSTGGSAMSDPWGGN